MDRIVRPIGHVALRGGGQSRPRAQANGHVPVDDGVWPRHRTEPSSVCFRQSREHLRLAAPVKTLGAQPRRRTDPPPPFASSEVEKRVLRRTRQDTVYQPRHAAPLQPPTDPACFERSREGSRRPARITLLAFAGTARIGSTGTPDVARRSFSAPAPIDDRHAALASTAGLSSSAWGRRDSISFGTTCQNRPLSRAQSSRIAPDQRLSVRR